MALVALVALVVLQRALELRVARRNEAWARERGAVEFGREHYRWFFALHAAWLAATLVEGWARGARLAPGWPACLALLALAQVLRYWAISSLGPLWNTRILVVPGASRVRRGPYRFLNHPNYVVVAIELLCLPLAFGAWVTALAATALNAALLLGVRIPAEERALRAYRRADP